MLILIDLVKQMKIKEHFIYTTNANIANPKWLSIFTPWVKKIK